MAGRRRSWRARACAGGDGDRYQTARTITRFLPAAPGSYHLEARLWRVMGVRTCLIATSTSCARGHARRHSLGPRLYLRGVPRRTGAVGARSVSAVGEDPLRELSADGPTHTAVLAGMSAQLDVCESTECVDGVCFAFPMRCLPGDELLRSRSWLCALRGRRCCAVSRARSVSGGVGAGAAARWNETCVPS